MALAKIQKTIFKVDSNTLPAAGHTYSIQNSGGGSAIPIYANSSGTVPLDNPGTLPANGLLSFFLRSGTCRIKVTDPITLDEQIWDNEPCISPDVLSSASATLQFPTLADLINCNPINKSETIDPADYAGQKVSIVVGNAGYIIKTAAQVSADGDIIDDLYINFWLLGGTDYAAVRVKTKSIEMDWLDTTGATSHSAEILAFLNAGYEVKLPTGVIGGSVITIPSGAKLSGAGAPRYDDTVPSDWDNTGTLLKFGINVDDCQDFVLSDFSVDDTTADGVSGGGVSLGRGVISRVNTKTTAHSFLFNLLCDDPAGALDPTNNVVGGVLVEYCEHWGGVNGFVSKHHGITFRRCVSHGTSSQSFVAISDNINGATTYNRATFTTFDRCWSDTSANDFRCYTRDVFSADPVNNVNTNNVQPCYYTQFLGCGSETTSQYPILLGDFDAAGYASLTVDNILIDDHADSIANFGFIRVERAKNVKIRGVFFRTGANVAINSSNCENILIDDSNTLSGTCTGSEVAPVIINSNSSTIPFSYWKPALVYRFQNTVATTVSTFSSICYGKPIVFWIDDNFTQLSLNGVLYNGKGSRIEAVNTSGTWRILSVSYDLCDSVQFIPFVGSGIDMSFDARRCRTLACVLTGSLGDVTSSASTITDGVTVHLRFDSDGSSRSISAFDSVFQFNGSAPTGVGAGNSLLITFYKHGAKLVEVNRIEYATP